MNWILRFLKNSILDQFRIQYKSEGLKFWLKITFMGEVILEREWEIANESPQMNGTARQVKGLHDRGNL